MIGQPLYLVACAKTKATSACPAKDLYRSPWFTKARRYVEAQRRPWFILSAKHGLLDPDAVIEPYEQTLLHLGQRERAEWARRVHTRLLVHRLLPPYVSPIVFLAGAAYREPLTRWITVRGRTPEVVEAPMQGLGLGEQLAWLTRHTPSLPAETAARRGGLDMPLFRTSGASASRAA